MQHTLGFQLVFKFFTIKFVKVFTKTRSSLLSRYYYGLTFYKYYKLLVIKARNF